ncbi:MAG: PilZ domain-containing protein [Desulfomonile tiedjei]|uniref:PilZ domain-containing protein n=1 Tax=Desulfomonile tiedjei TaxID=2358 RepID=A0A9D6UZA0_9BACT|nr:PilZ domain-containing protein [Desulfomonile tiedjei]
MSEQDPLAQRILEDVRERLNESELAKKHNLTAQELQSILADLDEAGLIVKLEGYYQVPFMRSINAEDIIRDVRSGVDDWDLNAKYGLTMQALANTIRLLMDGNRLSRSDLAGRENLFEEVMDPNAVRGHQRYYLDFELPIIEKGNGIRGKVHDLTEKGLGIIGISARVDEIKDFSINHEKFALINPFSFQARCRWMNYDRSSGECIAGFEIVDISPDDFLELQKLVRMVTIHVSPSKDMKFEYPRE